MILGVEVSLRALALWPPFSPSQQSLTVCVQWLVGMQSVCLYVDFRLGATSDFALLQYDKGERKGEKTTKLLEIAINNNRASHSFDLGSVFTSADSFSVLSVS